MPIGDILKKLLHNFNPISQAVAVGSEALQNPQVRKDIERLPEIAEFTAQNMPMGGSVAQLAEVKDIPPILKRALEWTTKKYPRMSKVVRESTFEDLNPGYKGLYNAYGDTAKVSLTNPATGMPRDPSQIMNTIAHEHFGHGIDRLRGVRGEPDRFGNYMDAVIQENTNIPYELRPSEVKARRLGDLLIRKLEDAGIF